MLSEIAMSAAQFVMGIIALSVAVTAWMTLILTNRRIRAERALLVIQGVRCRRPAGLEIDIENVGLAVALNPVVSIPLHSKRIAGGLRSGEVIKVGLPKCSEVTLEFRDVAGRHGA